MCRIACRIPVLGPVVLVAVVLGLAGCPPADNPNAPEANFTASPTQGALPLTVQFTDASLPGTSPIHIWFWDFGDGTFANTPNPSHIYTAPGVYTVSLTVETAEGKDSITKVDLVTVIVRSAFARIGAAGGSVSAGGATVSVPANALEVEAAVGVTLLDGEFETPSSEPIIVISAPFRIMHDSEATGFANIEGDGEIVPTTISLPILTGVVPVADRNGDKIHIVAKLQSGLNVPVFGQVQGDRFVASVTGLPGRATYGVVYQPSATTHAVAPPAGKAVTGAEWLAQWRVRSSPLMAQKLTALRVGEIDNTAAYLRTDFVQADVDATMAALDEFILATAGSFEDDGLRSPLLLNVDGAYEVALYSMAGPYATDYERYRDLVTATHLFGTLVIDPRQLLNVSLHNAENAVENPDGAQELSVENAFAQALYLASFEGYDYPAITALSPTDEDAAGQPRAVSFAQALVEGVAAYVGQTAAGFETARTFDPGEVSILTESLFAAFSDEVTGYATAAQDFIFFMARSFEVDLYSFLFAADPPGIIERLRAALDTLPGTPNFARATEELRLVSSEVTNIYSGETLAGLYWQFAQLRGVEAGTEAVLRPSDLEREPFTLQTDQFGEDTVVEMAFPEEEDSVFTGADDEPALRDIPPLSCRAVIVGVNPDAPSLTLNFNEEEWVEDDLGNSVAVKAYPEGRRGVELPQGESSLFVDLTPPICPLPDDPALLVQILFPLFDTDDDGGLSLAEAQALEPSINEFIFGFADLNSDGKLSLNEVLELVPVVFIDPLSLVDLNANGYLEREELGGLSDLEFAALDVNGNGAFDCEDLPPTEGKQVPEEPEELNRVIVLIGNLNLSAANSVYVNAVRPTPALR